MSESKVIQPTIGRRVWYFPSDHDRGINIPEGDPFPTIIQCDGTQPCDAGVCYVHSDRLVNLVVTDHNGNVHQRTSVTLIQPGDKEADRGSAYATWMPYQVSTAKPAA